MSTAATRVTPKRLKAFVVALTECGSVTDAAKAAGLSRQNAYRIRERNPKFAKAWDSAIEKAMDKLEAEGYRRAFEGTEEPVFYKGMECGAVRKYSDTLLMFLLNGRRGSVFKHRQEVSGPNGGPVEVAAKVIVLPAKNDG